VSPLLVLALVGSASATERLDWRLWSWSGVEARPSYAAESQLRLKQQLALSMRDVSGLSLDVSGAVRDPLAGDWVGDLHRLALGLRGARYSASLGRFVMASERGYLRLDGAQLDLGLAPAVTFHGWGGRSWHPETWEPGDDALVGGELRIDPGLVFSGGAGWEGRFVDESLVHRVHAFGRARSVGGAWATALAEAAPMEGSDSVLGLPARLALRGQAPLNKTGSVGAGLRWEDLERAVQPEALSSPMDWLAGPGYLAAELEGRVALERVTLQGSMGPTHHLHPEHARTGGVGRAGVGLELNDQITVGAALSGALAQPSWVWGGVAEARWRPGERACLGVEAGWFRFAPLEGPQADVVEGRLTAAAPLLRGDDGDLSLLAQVAGGSDRLLDPWVRGGLSLQGTFGRGSAP
jgi:hypothetical protein